MLFDESIDTIIAVAVGDHSWKWKARGNNLRSAVRDEELVYGLLRIGKAAVGTKSHLGYFT